MAKRFSMSEADRALVAQAVTAAEAHTDAEIVTIVARRSDAYHDVGLHWAILVAFLVPAFAATLPNFYESMIIWLLGGWVHVLPVRTLLLFLLANMLVKFLVVRYLLAIRPLRMFFTPRSTKTRRVRRRALALFHTAAEARTAELTGVLLYLSLDERRAEIITDKYIAERIAPEAWGEAMAAMIDEVRAGKVAQGMALAIEKAGVILAEHCPKSQGNPNELPNRLILL